MRVEVIHVLSLPERQAIARLTMAAEHLAGAFTRIADVVETSIRGGDSQEAVDALTERLRVSNAALADEVARILATNPQP